VSDQLHAPATLPSGKSSQYPIERKPSGTQSRSGCCGENSKFHLCRESTLDYAGFHPITKENYEGSRVNKKEEEKKTDKKYNN
jgi:hypothetical protein